MNTLIFYSKGKLNSVGCEVSNIAGGRGARFDTDGWKFNDQRNGCKGSFLPSGLVLY